MDPPQPPKSGNPAPSGSANTSISDSAPKYVPQFSAATEMILKRINSGTSAGSLGPIGNTGLLPGYDDMRRAVMSSMKTSHNMELPPLPQVTGRRNEGGRASVGSASSAGATIGPKSATAGTPKPRGRPPSDKNGTPGSWKGKGKGSARGKKRKRAQEESEESSSESLAMSDLGDDSDDDDAVSIPEEAAFPKVTQSGRAIVKPAQFVPAATDSPPKKRAAPKKNIKNQENALCKRCGRGHSPSNNEIVFCDDCQLGWHQMCHDPPISDEVKNDAAKWFCADCSLKRGIKKASPVAEPPKLVSWQGRSDAEKHTYLSSLSQQQLVNLLIQATTIEPNLPIFPSIAQKPPMQAYIPQQPQLARTSSISQVNTPNTFARTTATFHSHPPAPFPPSAVSTSGLFTRAEANPNGAMNFIRKIPPGQQRATPPSNASSPSTMNPPQFTKNSSAPPTLPPQPGPMPIGGGVDGGEDSRESTPASPPYPKAGSGLMAKLGPDDEDMEWLVDENDYEAFSHTVYEEHVVGGQR